MPLAPLFSAVALVLALPSVSVAQTAIALDVVLEPLVVAAEADVQRAALSIALSRATFVVSALSADTPLAARAEHLCLLVRQYLAGAVAVRVTPSVMLAPLVDAAEIDGASGRTDLAQQRLDFVLTQLAGTDALAVRATDLRASIVPPGLAYTVPSGLPLRRRADVDWTLAGPGIGLLAAGWVIGTLTTLVVTLFSATRQALFHMLVPLVGAWWTIAADDYRGTDIWFPAVVGVAQLAGLILLIVGLVSPRDDSEPQAGTVRVTPTANGLAIEGWF